MTQLLVSLYATSIGGIEFVHIFRSWSEIESLIYCRVTQIVPRRIGHLERPHLVQKGVCTLHAFVHLNDMIAVCLHYCLVILKQDKLRHKVSNEQDTGCDPYYNHVCDLPH